MEEPEKRIYLIKASREHQDCKSGSSPHLQMDFTKPKNEWQCHKQRLRFYFKGFKGFAKPKNEWQYRSNVLDFISRILKVQIPSCKTYS